MVNTPDEMARQIRDSQDFYNPAQIEDRRAEALATVVHARTTMGEVDKARTEAIRSALAKLKEPGLSLSFHQDQKVRDFRALVEDSGHYFQLATFSNDVERDALAVKLAAVPGTATLALVLEPRAEALGRSRRYNELDAAIAEAQGAIVGAEGERRKRKEDAKAVEEKDLVHDKETRLKILNAVKALEDDIFLAAGILAGAEEGSRPELLKRIQTGKEGLTEMIGALEEKRRLEST